MFIKTGKVDAGKEIAVDKIGSLCYDFGWMCTGLMRLICDSNLRLGLQISYTRPTYIQYFQKQGRTRK